MNLEDMILVSIDDHMIEPPDMFEHHVPKKWADEAPRVVHEAGIDQWEFQGEKTSTSFGMAATVGWPRGGVGLQPGHLHRVAPRLLRRTRAGARHECERRARLHVLPDDGRVERPDLRRVA